MPQHLQCPCHGLCLSGRLPPALDVQGALSCITICCRLAPVQKGLGCCRQCRAYHAPHESRLLTGDGKHLKLRGPTLLVLGQFRTGPSLGHELGVLGSPLNGSWRSRVLQTEGRRKQNSVRPGTDDFPVLIDCQRARQIGTSGFGQNEEAVFIGSLADDGAVRRDKELNVGEMPLEPETDFSLPFRV